ncbi:FAD-dependent thymidylate synthase [Burkholderia ubonensis]|uniref:FAD-dependent thymidylate synthase n=1 Tax=Burkholderia ubonensis TaxID=101571 RepID=UPI000759158C|nr:FAD-dependent thymidylate synthase [Burkholderia ubonensis]KVR21697.1 FAD-dependent thymidylate synthase [Burkholderia ubonensis]
MRVRLIAITKPVIAACTTAEELVVYCGRVSNPANQENHSTADRLLRYLVRNKHWSPFEMVHLVIEVVTTRDIARQILRHRSMSFQEFSQRYAEVVAEPVFREARLQDNKNRQNSLAVTEGDAIHARWKELQESVVTVTQNVYREALNLGIAKEVARAVLPEGMTESTMYIAGTLRSWLHFLAVRGTVEGGTQLEHRHVALACRDVIANEFPALAPVIFEG